MRVGAWTPGVVMNPKGSWATWALPTLGKEPRTSIAKAGDPKLRTNVSVGIVTSWLAPRSKVQVQAPLLERQLQAKEGAVGRTPTLESERLGSELRLAGRSEVT